MTSLAPRAIVAMAAIVAFATTAREAPALQLALWNGGRGPAGQFGSETWLASGAASVPAGWFGDVLLAKIAPLLGTPGLVICAAFVFAIAITMTAERARLRGGAIAAACAVVLAFATAVSAFHVGDRLATDTLFTALTLAALDRRGRSRNAAVAAIFVWAWFTPDALVGVLFAVASAAGTMLDARLRGDRDTSETRETWIVAAASFVATLATPATIGYVTASLGALGLDGKKPPFSIFPGDAAPLAYHLGFTALVFVAVVVGGTYGPAAFMAMRTRASAIAELAGASGPADAAILAVAIVLGFSSGHLLPVAGIAAAPVLAGAFARRFGTLRGPGIAPLAVTAAGIAGMLVAIEIDRDAGPTRYDSTPLVAQIAADPNAHALYCGQPLWCDAALGSHVRVGVDGRPGWPDQAISDQLTIATIGPHWVHLLAHGGVDRVVAFRTTALAGMLRLQPGWREIGDDGRVAAFARRLPQTIGMTK